LSAVPIEVVTVERVDRVPTQKPDCTQFLVVAHGIVAPYPLVRYQTLNQWIASLCERAKATERRLRVTWREHRFGRELVYVEMAE